MLVAWLKGVFGDSFSCNDCSIKLENGSFLFSSVLLVDVNLENPGLSLLFDAAPNVCLQQYIEAIFILHLLLMKLKNELLIILLKKLKTQILIVIFFLRISI